jgi:predicted DNA-binding transcriptional regulator AlpA
VPVQISGQSFFLAKEVAQALGVSRQTLWRWRQEGCIPAGSRFRDRQVVFTESEFALIREYAQRLEPAATSPEQLKLFNSPTRRTG